MVSKRNEEVVEPTELFPLLMEHVDEKFIMLSNYFHGSSGKGMVVWAPEGYTKHTVGEYSDIWAISRFRPLKGLTSITLSNAGKY